MKKRTILLIGLSIILGNVVYGQGRNVIGTYVSPKTSKTAKATSTSKSSNKKEKDPTIKLAERITKNASTDREKVYAIYKWIASNIAYDNQLRMDEDLQRDIYVSEKNVVKKALEREMALCGGFAFLFRDLCEKVNIEAEVVHGFTKNYSGRIHEYTQPNHTWNVVKLNNRWELLDITWAIGYGSNNKPDDFWFLTSPKDFIYSHYPENPGWTLLSTPISFADFKRKR